LLLGRQHDDQDLRRGGVLFQDAADSESVDPGEDEVEKDKVRFFSPGQVDGFLAGPDAQDLIALFPENKGEAVLKVDIVFNDQNLNVGSTSCGVLILSVSLTLSF
jgi:hypothetical protein